MSGRKRTWQYSAFWLLDGRWYLLLIFADVFSREKWSEVLYKLLQHDSFFNLLKCLGGFSL